MKEFLATRLLAELMKWDSDKAQQEMTKLSAMAKFKFNEYQQFTPGTRFMESLARWLSQFDQKDRSVAYSFVMDNLIFFSNDEVLHLVEITFHEQINPKLLTMTGNDLGIADYLVEKITKSDTYKVSLRKSLFIGMSDGSRIAHFRRNNPQISNEQVHPTYELSVAKCKDLIKDLNEDLEKYKLDGEQRFENVFLIDDFTASGLSYFRIKKYDDQGKPVYGGKIFKFLNRLLNGDQNEDEDFKKVFYSKLSVSIIFYIATNSALTHIRKMVEGWKDLISSDITCDVSAIHPIDDEAIKDSVLSSESFLKLIKDNFDPRVVDSNIQVGAHDNPWLGFNECGLTIVLNHNCPNNSLPIIWTPIAPVGQKVFSGLFPRMSRHKDEVE